MMKKNSAFTPLEKAIDFNRWYTDFQADGGLKQASARTLRGRSSLTGFTLLELLIVMTILGLLASIIVPRFTSRINQARRLKAVLQIKNISEALENYYVENSHYPTTQQGLKVLLEKGKTGQSYLLSDHLPKDPWGQEYQYISPGLDDRDYDILSYAADSKLGGTGWEADIKSWDMDDEEIF